MTKFERKVNHSKDHDIIEYKQWGIIEMVNFFKLIFGGKDQAPATTANSFDNVLKKKSELIRLSSKENMLIETVKTLKEKKEGAKNTLKKLQTEHENLQRGAKEAGINYEDIKYNIHDQRKMQAKQSYDKAVDMAATARHAVAAQRKKLLSFEGKYKKACEALKSLEKKIEETFTAYKNICKTARIQPESLNKIRKGLGVVVGLAIGLAATYILGKQGDNKTT